MGDTQDNLKAILADFKNIPDEKCPKCGGRAVYIGPLGNILLYECTECGHVID